LKRLLRAGLAALAVGLLGACVPAGQSRAGANTLVFTGLAGEPDSLDPLITTMSDVSSLAHLYLSYLVETDDRGRLVPEIATAVPTQANGGISADGRTIVYDLRRGVRWQDGAPLTARDVIFTYRAAVNPGNDVPVRVGYDEVSSIRADGDYRVVVRLRRPFAPFVSWFMGPEGYGLLPAHLLEGYRTLNHVPYNALPVGSGPFRVVQWSHGDRVVLVANPSYWRGRPRIDRIVYRIVPDPNTRLELLQTGEADAYFDADPLLLPRLRALAGVVVTLTPINDMHVLRFNLRDPVLADPSVRRAIAMAIDRPQLIEAATHGSGIVVDADQPRNGWAYDGAVAHLAYDPAAARRLLAGRKLSLTLAVSPAGINGSALAAAVIQRNLHDAGIEVAIKTYPMAQLWGPAAAGGVMASGHFELAYDAWWVLSPDPDDSWNLACDQRPPNGENYDDWCDPVAERAMEDALARYDPSERARDYAVIQREIVRELPFLTLWQVRMPDAYRTRLHGVAPAPFGSIFWNAWKWYLSPARRR